MRSCVNYVNVDDIILLHIWHRQEHCRTSECLRMSQVVSGDVQDPDDRLAHIGN